MSYVEPREMRHRIEIGDAGEQVRIPMRRQWFALAFLPFWLAAWTAGGIFAIAQIMQHFEPFLLVWLCGWAIGWLFGAGALAAQIAGTEILRVAGGDLVASLGIGRLRRSWRYRGAAIRNLTSCEPTSDPWGQRRPNWGLQRSKTGAVKFDYGADTIYLAGAVDEPEGRAIAAWLAQRLPRGATG